jgi:hypothetical protein
MQVMGELRRLDRTEGAGINISILLTYDDGGSRRPKGPTRSVRQHFE